MVLFASGCAHHRQTAGQAPQTAPAVEETYPAGNSGAGRGVQSAAGRIPPTPLPPGGVTPEDIRYVNTHPPILTEVGLATWYRAPYRGRAANGEVFNDAAFTAAHRTLPMGSLVVVTNLSTGQWAAMRISDRGPFVEGRIVDLTIASAKATGVYRAGLARVRLDVYQTPKPIDTGGRWCVQVGAFRSERQALRLKSKLSPIPRRHRDRIPGVGEQLLGPHSSPGRRSRRSGTDCQADPPLRGGSLPHAAGLDRWGSRMSAFEK